MKMTTLICQQAQPSSLQRPTRARHLPVIRPRLQKDKVVVVMGATGAGKSRLSIDLADRYHGEIINSDKIQVYNGVDILTNKITEEECAGVRHHLLGTEDPNTDFTKDNFIHKASHAIKTITGQGKLPIIAGGSNSFIEALIDDRTLGFRSRYDVCFLWVDVDMRTLRRFIYDRVDRMVNAGMVEEVEKLYKPNSDYTKGVRKAIGIPEFDSYLRAMNSSSVDNKTCAKLLQRAINLTKINTFKLACKQLKRIQRLRDEKGWRIHRLDATAVFQNRGDDADELWEETLAGPGAVIVNQFLFNFGHYRKLIAAEDDDLRANIRPDDDWRMFKRPEVDRREDKLVPAEMFAVR